MRTICFTFLLFFSVITFSSPQVADSDNLLIFDSAEQLWSDTSKPPDFSLAKKITLPDKWQYKHDDFYGSTWYQLHFTLLKKPDEQWAIYLPYVNMNAEVWLNGIRLGSGGNMEAPLSRYWHIPMKFVVSPSDLQKDNTLSIRVVAFANMFGGLGQIVIGPGSIIDNSYRQDYFSKVNIHIISASLATVYALFMGYASFRRKDPVFFWGAMVCSAWALSSLNLFIINPPFSELLWEKIMQATMGWIPLLFFFFILRLDGVVKNNFRENSILLIALLINILLVLVDKENLFLVSRLWHIYAMFWGIIGVIHVFYSWVKYRGVLQFTMVAIFSLIAICGAHDLLVQNNILQLGSAFWLDYSIPLILLLIGYLMVSRFLQAVSTAERLNFELESRIMQAQVKIENDYEIILGLETEKASLHERERIYRDMHDDMGSKLLSMIYGAESDETRILARSAMDDLRAIVSNEPGEKHRLSEVLDKWKRTSETRCSEAGFDYEWKSNGVLAGTFLSVEADQNLRRIQSESITNVLKHSTGNKVSILVRCRFGCLIIRVSDDGDYTQMSRWQEGRGINTMRFRVAQLQGRIYWRKLSDNSGCVRWLIPLASNCVKGIK